MTEDVLAFAASLRLSSGDEWGAVATGWQLDDLRAVLAADTPRWHLVTRGRGGSKTTDLAVVALALLVHDAPLMSRSYAVASDADQGALLLDAMRGLVTRTPGLQGALRFDARKVTATDSGATLEVLAADGPSAYGLLPWLVVADELAQWPETPNALTVWEAVLSAMPKVPDARLVVLTSAGSPSHWSYKVLQRARQSPRWRVSEVPGPTPWLDDSLLAELAAILPPSAYARLVLNEWTEPDDRLVLTEDLRACVTHTGPLAPKPGVGYVASLDMAYVHDRAAAAVCHRERSGRVVLDRLEVWAGSRRHPVQEAAVEDWLMKAWRAYGPRLMVDPWQTKGMAQRLRARGMRVEEFGFSAQSVGRLALTLYRLLRDHLVALPDDEELLDELAAVRLRETAPGAYRLDHDASQHDDRAIALAMCAYWLVEHGGRRAQAQIGPSRRWGSTTGTSSTPFSLDEWRRGVITTQSRAARGRVNR
jgi:phage terminase large subunit-like protein